jgi:hypothetical protein
LLFSLVHTSSLFLLHVVGAMVFVTAMDLIHVILIAFLPTSGRGYVLSVFLSAAQGSSTGLPRFPSA